MRKIDRDRIRLLEKIEKRALSLFDKLERQFLNGIIKELESILIIKDNKVENVSKNYVNLHKLGLFQQQFEKRNVSPLLGWMAKSLIRVTRINTKYYERYDIKKIKDSVENESLRELGIKRDGKDVKLVRNSLLDQIGKFEDPYLAVRNIATQSIASGVPLNELRKQIRETIRPEGKYGKIKSHFYTIANDIFSEHDRKVQLKYGERLGFKAFIYFGGEISTTRDFCAERNGKVFTVEEAERWRNLEWEGKPKIYNPLIHLGGYNCRHSVAWIDQKEAIRRRPELEKYYNQ